MELQSVALSYATDMFDGCQMQSGIRSINGAHTKYLQDSSGRYKILPCGSDTVGPRASV